jgi:hypothetical protein
MSIPESFGSMPANVKWKVVRGDTATLRIQFLENDEETFLDTSDWNFLATARNILDNISYELTVIKENGYVDIMATPDQTMTWGTGFGPVVEELVFDLEVTIVDTVWTPVLGTIYVYGDVTVEGGL